MNEFNEDYLHEYLDGTLDEQTRQAVEAHLAQSPGARAQLAELEGLFSSLDALPELPLGTDLSARVVAAVGQETAVTRLPRWVWGLLLGQMAIALLLLGNVWPSLLAWLDNGRAMATDWLATVQLSTSALLTEFWAEVTAVWQSPTLPTFTIELPTAQWGLLLGLALVVWLAGNRLLFTTD
ncbi:anti-sigma factor family protein [Candidatus Leptofilum sp.]|uniref:anti-sigma factor family protein n=1 Tax=Candidatus Leptofilum sp. TaxID=3241576 RepID=UPI003B5BA374